MLTWATRDSAESMREIIVGNAENQRMVGIELKGVRVLAILASATAVDE